MKRKVRRYAEGSEDAVGFEEGPPGFEKPETFKEAFKKARAKGKGTEFTWRGKKIAAYREGEEPESWKKKTPAKTESADKFAPKENKLNLPKTERLDISEGEGPRRTRFAMADYYAKNPEEGAKTGEISEALIGPKAKAAAGAAAAGAAGYGMKKVRDYLMGKAASARKTMTDVAKGDLSMARPAAAREAEAAAYAERIKNARRSPGMTGYKKGGSVSFASKRADGIAQRGKTKGRFV
jgi:hypothetical protein